MAKFYTNKPLYTNSINDNIGNKTDDIIKIDNISNITIGNHRINTVLKEDTANITLDKNKPGSFYFINKSNININTTDLINNYHFYIAHINHEDFVITNIPNIPNIKKKFYHIKVKENNSLEII